MTAKAGPDIMTYEVTSETGGQCYTVCLTDNDGVGWCDCPNFQYRCTPRIAKGERVACKHVRCAREQLSEDIITRQVEILKELEAAADDEMRSTGYGQAVARFLKANPRCGVCNLRPSVDPHHSRGRLGPLLSLEEFWVPVCRSCHDWIHANPNAARAKSWNGIPLLAPKGEFNRLPEGYQ